MFRKLYNALGIGKRGIKATKLTGGTMGEVSLWAKILVPILIFGGLIWKEGGLKGVFESYRDQYRQWGLKGTILFLLALVAWVIFLSWITN